MKKNLLFIAVAAVALASCAKELSPVESLKGGKVITALTDSKVVSKTTLASDNNVLWAESDAVTAFVGTDKYASSSTAVSGEGKIATFTFSSLDSSADVDYVLYPADKNATISSGVISTNLTTLQRIIPGSFANGANLAVGEGAAEVTFKNACAFLSVKVNGDNIHSVKLIADKALTGEVTVDYNGGEPVVAAKEGGKTANYVQLAGAFESGNTYYFVVLPGTYSGLTMEFTDNQGRKATFVNSTTLTVGRNENLKIANITIPEGKWQAPTVENAINMRKARLFPKWEGAQLGTVSEFTLETLVKFNQFDHDSATKVYNVMGIEGVFNCRVRRDVSGSSNILQVSNSSKLNATSKPFSTGVWYHIAVTFNNGSVKVYIDGELVAQTSNIGASSIALSPEWNAGDSPRCFWYGYAYDANRWFDGQMAEMRIWTKELTAEEVNAPGHFYFVDPSTEGLFSCWTLCSPEGDYVLDATGNGNTLYGQINVSSTGADAGINWAADPLTSIAVEASSTSFSCSEDSFTVDVTATNKSWSITECPAWVTPDVTSGEAGSSTVNFAVAANEGDARQGTITFTCGSKTASVTVKQAAYVACPPLTLASDCETPLDVFVGVQCSSDSYVGTVPGATLTWTINDGGDAWTATCSPATGANFSYDAAAHTITLVIPEAATATQVNKWEIVASKTGDTGNYPLVLTATQQCYNRYTLTAEGATTKYGYVASEVRNCTIEDGTYDIIGYDGSFYFLLNLYRVPTETIISGNIKLMTDFFGFKSLLQDLQGGNNDSNAGSINQCCECAWFDIVSDGAGFYTIRPYACQNLGLGQDAEENLCIGPEYKDTKWTIGWNGTDTTRWKIKLGDSLYLNVDDSHTDITGSTNKRNITLKGSKSAKGFKLFKVNF